MGNFSDCRENQNTNFVLNKFFFSENHVVNEIMWKNIVEPGRPQMTIWHMRFARSMTKAISTGLEYVIIITFPLPQWLHKRVSVLGYTYTACLVSSLCRPIEST